MPQSAASATSERTVVRNHFDPIQESEEEEDELTMDQLSEEAAWQAYEAMDLFWQRSNDEHRELEEF